MRRKFTPAGQWSPQEDQFLQDNYRQHSHQQLSEMLDRTINAVRNRCARLGLRRAAEHWTAEDISILRQWYTDHDGKRFDLQQLADQLGRHKTNVSRKARELGLTNLCRTTVKKSTVDGHVMFPSTRPMKSDHGLNQIGSSDTLLNMDTLAACSGNITLLKPGSVSIEALKSSMSKKPLKSVMPETGGQR